MNRTKFLCIAIVIGLLLNTAAYAQMLEKYRDRGPDANRLVLVVTGDGYTNAQQQQLRSDAVTLIDHILQTSPWDTFADSTNVYILQCVSSESGADKPWLGIYRNTYLHASYGTNGSQHCLAINQNILYPYIASYVPNYDEVIVVVNDTMYGGSGHNAAVTSLDPAAPQIIVHELGHTFAGLEEEYTWSTGNYPGIEPPNPNVTIQTNPALIKWRAWIDPTVPIPTVPQLSYQTQVGLFEGAFGWTNGVFRPSFDCCMRNLGSPFCSVCKEAHVLAAHATAVLVDEVAPQSGPIVIPMTMDFRCIGRGWTYLTKAWSLDGNPVSTADVYRLRPGQIAQPFSLLTLTVTDNTPLVRSYPLPSQTWQWKLNADIRNLLSVADIRYQPLPCTVGVTGRVSAVFSDCFYIQDADRTAGIRAEPYAGFPQLGKTVTVSGEPLPKDMNLTLLECTWSEHTGVPSEPKPLGMRGQSVGGRNCYGQIGIVGATGINNVGLLVRIWGRVTYVDPGGSWMSVDDGSGVNELFGPLGVKVLGTSLQSFSGGYVGVTGVSTIGEAAPGSGPIRVVRTRSASDIVLLD